MALTPYTGPFGTPELKHLLRRSLYGAAPADLVHFAGQSLDQVADELLTFTNDTTPPIKAYWGLNGTTPDPSLVDPDVPFGSTWIDTVRTIDDTEQSSQRVASFVFWRTGLMAEQQRNLREKLTLFWFNHMPNQVFQVFNPRVSYDYDQLLRNKCMGNFRELIYDVSTSGAMLIYLNGFLNTVNAPDENFARELMELFTLGEGSGYTEADVQTAARVLTGWTVQEDILGTIILPQVIFRPPQHDTNDKLFSAFFNNTVITGQSGPDAGATELNALLDMICAKEEVSKFICRELYRFFTHGEIDATVETNVIEPLAELFRDNASAPDQMRTVVRALLTSDHFFSDTIRGCMIKSPADLVVGALRQLGMPFPTPAQFEAQYNVWAGVYYLISYCGQELVNPPNVAGWPAYYQYPLYDSIWMDTATYPARNFSMQGILYNGFVTDGSLYQPESQNLTFKIDLLAVVAQFTDPYDPNVLVAEAAELLFAIPVSQGVRDQLKTNYLLLGQQNDFYWSDAYEIYVLDPNTTDMTAQLVPFMLLTLFLDMCGAAETQMH
ncbi:MAG: DUF1800 domain-containing protein [Flavobacteriales bacterium]